MLKTSHAPFGAGESTMSLRPTLRALAALSGVISALACAHCGSNNSELASGQPPENGRQAPDASQKELNDTASDAAPTGAVTLPQAPPALDDGLLLVNATRAFPAFRVCPPDGSTGVLSTSNSKPIPTTLMPRSSLAGVDINGASRIDPQPEFAESDDVVVLIIDDSTKGNSAIESGSCGALACTQTGANCLGSSKLFRVPVRDAKTNASQKGAFASKGRILALRDDGGPLRFEVLTISNEASANASELRVDYRNLSDYKGPVTYLERAGASPKLMQEATPELVKYNRNDYGASQFRTTGYSASLVDIQQASDPRVPIDSFFRSPGSFALILVGTTGDAGPERSLRFLAVPVTAPKVVTITDGGTNDAASDGGTD